MSDIAIPLIPQILCLFKDLKLCNLLARQDLRQIGIRQAFQHRFQYMNQRVQVGLVIAPKIDRTRVNRAADLL